MYFIASFNVLHLNETIIIIITAINFIEVTPSDFKKLLVLIIIKSEDAPPIKQLKSILRFVTFV